MLSAAFQRDMGVDEAQADLWAGILYDKGFLTDNVLRNSLVLGDPVPRLMMFGLQEDAAQAIAHAYELTSTLDCGLLELCAGVC